MKTRSQTHKTFNDDEPIGGNKIQENPMKIISDDQDQEDEGDSSSDDAPEEENVTTIKKSMKEQKIKENQLFEEERQKQKERRRQIDLQNQSQKKDKELKQSEKDKNAIKRKHDEDELPDELPQSLLEGLEDNNEIFDVVKPKKIKFDELERKKKLNELKQEKLLFAREENKLTAEIGPVKVKVVQRQKYNVPKSVISNKKDQWLKRKSVKRG